MGSVLTWLDFSEHERRKALDVVDLFREKDTRDERGVGMVRDALADLLFPGTCTIQTRARYFLFVPWLYKRLERQKSSVPDAARLARRAELNLIDALADSGETDGVIGIEARQTLKRLPSNVYWQGLAVGGYRDIGQTTTVRKLHDGSRRKKLRSRRRLLFHPRQRLVDASPTRSAGRPYRHRRACQIRIVERPRPDKDQMRPRLGLAEERRAASRAEPAVHSIAAVGDTREVARLPGYLESRSAKGSTHRSAACAQVLAVSAPAHARHNGRLLALPSNRAA